MSNQKIARSGLLLFLTVGPILVFLFLYLFGKNKFEIDSYSIPLSSLAVQPVPKSVSPIIILPSEQMVGSALMKDYQNQQKRISLFLEGVKLKPTILQWNESNILATPLGERLLIADTLVETLTVKGKGQKQLPPSPRAFMFDSAQNLRGVYGLCNSLSVDTLILEYKILTGQ